jgi:hypothetical protein
VDPNDESVTVVFEYGIGNFNSQTPAQTFAGKGFQPITADLAGLTSSGVYQVRMRVTGSNGPRVSGVFTYGAPIAATGSASDVGSRGATIRGAVNARGRETTASIQYGVTAAYGQTAALGSVGNGSEPVAVSGSITGLSPQVTYHYRIVATNDAGTSLGNDEVFTTTQNSVPRAPALLGLSNSLTAQVLIPLPPNLDADGDTLTLSFPTQPAFGAASVLGSSVIVFTPGPTFKGTDQFTYRLDDGRGGVATGDVVVRNPFLSLKGTFTTFLRDVNGTPSGAVKITLAPTGKFTGTVTFAGVTYPVSGTFDPASGDRAVNPVITIVRPGLPSLALTLKVDPSSADGAVSGSLTAGGATFSVAPASRNVAAVRPAQAGRYTVWLPPNVAQAPLGNGWATLVVGPTGLCTLAGKLPDGTAFSTAPVLHTDGTLLVNVTLYVPPPPAPAPARGFLFGQLRFREKPNSDADGSFLWKRGAQAASAFYPAGWTAFSVNGFASRWVKPTSVTGNHAVTFGEGDLVDDFTKNFVIAPPGLSGIGAGSITTTNAPQMVKLQLNYATGVFSGTFVHPLIGALKPRAFSGVLFQKQNAGIGVFLGKNNSGFVEVDLQ